MEVLGQQGADDEVLGLAGEIARLEARAGDTTAALAGLKRALARTPLETLEPLDRPYAELSICYAELGDAESARELLAERRTEGDTLRSAHRSMPHLARAAVAIADGRPQHALDLIDGSPPCCWTADLLKALWRARAHAAMGRMGEAILGYEEFLSMWGKGKLRLNAFYLAEVLQRLGALYEEQGEPTKAAEYYRRFVDLWEDADPELQPRVEAARERVRQLTGRE